MIRAPVLALFVALAAPAGMPVAVTAIAPAFAQVPPSPPLLQRQQQTTGRMLQEQLLQRRQQIRDRQTDELRRRTDELLRRQAAPRAPEPYTAPPLR